MIIKKPFVALLLGFVSLSSCSKQPLENAAYLNKQDCAIVIFKDNLSKEELGFNENVTFETVFDLSSIPETDRKYTLLLIDCSKHYLSMTKEAVESVYNWVHDASSFKMAAWYDAKDYSFLGGEPYNYYSEDEEVPVFFSHYNFDVEGTMSGHVNVGGIGNPISDFSRRIKAHVENLY